MKKDALYRDVKFPTSVLEQALRGFEESLPSGERPVDFYDLNISRDGVRWTFDNPDEFFAEHRLGTHAASGMSLYGKTAVSHALQVLESPGTVRVIVSAPERRDILAVSSVFERNVDACRVPAPPPPPIPTPRVFIGHGSNTQWHLLKNHLQDQHGYDVEAYETGARAGHTIRDVLDDMVRASSFAVLVMTAEDEMADGAMHARQNVVHETGLFQGALGFSRAIVVLEDGVTEYSNLAGIQQIRYSAGNIRETFGDVLATLRREFGAR